MDRDLVEIREAMEWARKELTRVRDHVDYQLDLRAPFAFVFNRITQDPTTEPPVTGTPTTAPPATATQTTKPPTTGTPTTPATTWTARSS